MTAEITAERLLVVHYLQPTQDRTKAMPLTARFFPGELAADAAAGRRILSFLPNTTHASKVKVRQSKDANERRRRHRRGRWSSTGRGGEGVRASVLACAPSGTAKPTLKNVQTGKEGEKKEGEDNLTFARMSRGVGPIFKLRSVLGELKV